MKKIIFFLASIIAVLTFVSEASALPLFARQTGMECSACHFQHFPMLNSFGRAFKSGAYTMMGAQTKVEGDRLSIPSTLNMAVLTTFGYEKTNAAPAGTGAAFIPGTNNDGNGTVYTPGHNGELSLFFGGRINDNAGFLTEVGMIGPVDQSSAKMPILFEVAEGTRAGIVPFTTNGQGASYGFEVLNTGANAIHQMSGVGGFNGAHSNAISAQQYIGTGAAATGVAFVVNNPAGFINATKYNQMGSGDLTGGNNTGSGSVMGAGMDSTYLRVAGIFDVAGWDTGVGIQSWSGSSVCMPDTVGLTCDVVSPGGPALVTTTKATAIDGQMQGALGNMPVGFYASYARAPFVSGTAPNSYNMGGTLTRSSFNVSGEVGVLPGIATLGAAIRLAKSGVATASGANATDNAIMLTTTYKVSQNMMASLSYTTNSGSYWDRPSGNGTLTNAQNVGSKTTTINLFTLF